LPYLGEAKELAAEPTGGGVDVTIPAIEKGMVVWCE
jgi:hypothetical protein